MSVLKTMCKKMIVVGPPHLFSSRQYLCIHFFCFFQLTQIEQYCAIGMLCFEYVFVFRSKCMGIGTESTIIHTSGIVPFVLWTRNDKWIFDCMRDKSGKGHPSLG